MDEKPLRVIILGALSAIAEAAARIWASHHAHLLLVGRDSERLETVAADLRLRGALVYTIATDLAKPSVDQAFGAMVDLLQGIDVVLLAYGVLGDQKLAETNNDEAQRIINTNLTSAAGWCLAAANVLEKQGHGTLIVIGSVAGDRGRASNYVYGASKGGMHILIQGIAHRLARTGEARAILIKAGFVDTPMTASIGKQGLLWVKPATIAKVIVSLVGKRHLGRVIVYAPWFWRYIMYAIRFMPTSIFQRTSL
jgi:decaprenylphospho-beta-D-erythro-pentofuranosid-2-ulose 2-reductase